MKGGACCIRFYEAAQRHKNVMNILVVGAVVCDIAAKPVGADAIEKRRIEIDSLNISGGGDANNASIDLATFGEQVRIVSKVGNDFLGSMLTEQLQTKGVDTRYLLRDPETETTAAILMLGPGGSSTISARRNGACDTICEKDVPDEALEWADHLHVVNVLNMPMLDGEGLAELFRRAHAHGITTSMDMKRPRKLHDEPLACIKEALPHCDVFLPSDHEIEYVTGLTDPVQATEFLRPFAPKLFVMKRGAEGVYVTDFSSSFTQPSLYEGTPVDVVGAGDAFSSTFVASWKNGYTLEDCARLASNASAHVLSKIGTTAGMCSRKELIDDLNRRGYHISNK